MTLCNENAMYVASVVATYWVVSISMVYLNKVLMSSESISIPAPLFVTWFQCIVTTLICWVAGKCGERAQNNTSYTVVSTDEDRGGASLEATSQPKPSFFAQFPKAQFEYGIANQVFPLSIVFVAMITFNNLCLKWVEVSFYNVARSLTIVFNVFFSSVFLGQTSSLKTLLCLFIVIIGFFIGSYGELNFSLYGTVAGVLSSLFVSLNSIFTKKILPVVEDNHWRLTFYNNVNASFLFIPFILYFEGDVLLNCMKGPDSLLANPVFWTAMCVAGFFGFSIGIVTVLQIKVTSPLSHNISGTAKAAVQSMMAFYIWENNPTLLGVMGIFTVLGGSLLYTFVKMKENREASIVQQQQQEQRSLEMTANKV